MSNIQCSATSKTNVTTLALVAVFLTATSGAKALQLESEIQLCNSVIMESCNDEGGFVTDAKAARWLKFQDFTRQWRAERGSMSSITEMSMLPSYQNIVGMGLDALPLILAELRAEGDDPDQWFWALITISKANDLTPPQVKPEDQGNFRKMAEAWLAWSETQDYAG